MRNFLLLVLFCLANIVIAQPPSPVSKGGTGNSTFSVGSILTGNGTSPLIPISIGTAGQTLQVVSGVPAWVTAPAGTVTSVALSLPNIFSVTGSPITSSGTFSVSLASQSQNLVFASPNGSSGTPSFRAIVLADFPNIADQTVLANNSGSSGKPSALTASQTRSLLGLGSAALFASSDFLNVANNLSDLNNVATARTNLGLGSAATHPAGDFIFANAPISGATKTKITYDLNGLVTSGTDATTADITSSTDKRYVTDAQLTVIQNTSGTNTGDQTITLTGDVTGSGTGSFATTYNGTVPVNKGGTNTTSYAKGDILVAQSSTVLTKVGVGSDGQVLTADAAQTTGVKWGSAGGSGTVTSVDATGSHGITTSGVPITGSGTIALDLSLNGVALDRIATIADATILGNNSGSTGTILALTASQTKTLLSLNNVENTALSTWAGSANITTLGTISTGTWSATTVAVNKGGTGQTSYTDGQLLIGNSSSNTLTKATLTAGSGISITNGNGSITIDATGGGGMTNPMTTTGDVIYSSDNSGTPARLGVGSSNQILAVSSGLPSWQTLTGTSNQVIVTGLTLSTPQNIHTSATPQFSRLGLGAAADATASLLLNVSSATTNAVVNTERLQLNSTGTAAALFGHRRIWEIESSTTDNTEAAYMDVYWSTATHASRTAQIDFKLASAGFAPSSSTQLTIKGNGHTVLNTSVYAAGILTVSTGDITANTLAAGSVLFGSSTTAVTGNSTNLTFSASNGLFAVATSTGALFRTNPSANSTVTNTLIIDNLNSGTSANGVGTGFLFRGKTSTTSSVDIGQISVVATDVTHATATDKLTVQLKNNGAALAEVLSLSGPGVLTLTNLASGAMYSVSGVVSSEANLDVTRGGTGVGTLTANGVLLGNGTSDIAVTAVGTTGQVLAGNTGSAPTFQTLTGGGYLTSDVTTTSTSFVDVTGMSFAVGANEVWTFEMYIIGAGVNNANCEVAINGPASPTAVDAGLAKINASSTVAKRVASYDAGFTSFTIEASSATIYKMNGIIRNGSNAGTVILRVKSLDAADAGIAANSYVEAHKK